jgi:hypothetical protein
MKRNSLRDERSRPDWPAVADIRLHRLGQRRLWDSMFGAALSGSFEGGGRKKG